MGWRVDDTRPGERGECRGMGEVGRSALLKGHHTEDDDSGEHNREQETQH
jgi:hypothetical protein